MDSDPPGRRASAVSRAVTVAGFAWNTSPTPLLARTRHWIGGELPARVGWVRSRADAGQPAFVYAGLREGFSYVLPFLEERRGGTGIVRESGTVRWSSLARNTPGSGPTCSPSDAPPGGPGGCRPGRRYCCPSGCI